MSALPGTPKALTGTPKALAGHDDAGLTSPT
ncbi:hypothetical protein MILUP08_43116 [Micromonospora lupini str. Lupac 08]|uniref:Uncharacterized protein n=1 Tax=Micromonospora lupini str. Lupac 08 TaxID=1150864 RepID=I0L314_9ACTN|nr:hypothetical protein MILUP08_43116 [Micromonospora lupini str. Lupac 08]